MSLGREGRNGALDADDAALWAHVTAQVRPLKRKKIAKRAVPAKGEKNVKSSSSRATPSVSEALRPATARLPLAPGAREKLPRGDERSLRRGEIAIDGRLDLHGLTRDEAHRAVKRFLAAMATHGERVALVITGKGSRADGGVLRSEFPRWLHEGTLAATVLAWRPAAPRHGGDGAFYVLLRRKPRP